MSFETDPSKPIVVDSPVETLDPNAIETPPIDDLLEATPVESADGGDLLDEHDPDETVVIQKGARAATDADRIAAIGQTIGADLSRFKTVEDAQAAADMVYERFASMGGDGDIASVLAPDAEDDAPPVDEELGLDEATTDLAVLAAFKKQNARLVDMQKKMSEKTKADSAQQRQNIVNGIQAQAESFLDGLKADTFGKAGSRNIAQKAKAEVVHKMATKAVAGLIQEARRSGNAPNLSMNDVMDWAVKNSGFAVEKKPAAGAAPAKKAYSLPPKSPNGGKPAATQSGMPRVSAANDPNGYFTGEASKDAGVRAIWTETLRRINS